MATILLFAVLAAFQLAKPAYADAANPQFLASWRTFNFAPNGFEGKLLPIENSIVRVAFEIIENGKIADLHDKEIRWIIDGERKKVEKALQTYSFLASRLGGSHEEIRIQIPDYEVSPPGASTIERLQRQNQSGLDHVLKIPVVEPVAVLGSSGRNSDVLPSPSAVTLQAKPYFFNVYSQKDLRFDWTVNGGKVTGEPANPGSLKINLGRPETKSASLEVSLSVTNPKKRMEFASGSLNFRIVPQNK